MKKIILVPALVGVLGIGAAFGSVNFLTGSAQEGKPLSVQEIEAKAQKIIKGKVTDVEFEQEPNRAVYEVDVTTSSAEFELKFDAHTGELLKKRKTAYFHEAGVHGNATADRHATFGNFDDDHDDYDYDDDDRSVTAAAVNKTTNTTTQKPTAQKSIISQEKAVSIALSKVNGQITKVELDDGKYEIEVVKGNVEYDMEINAFTGKITSYKEDRHDDDDHDDNDDRDDNDLDD